MTRPVEVFECREPVAAYEFSVFGTSISMSDKARTLPPARRVGASLLLTGAVLFGGLGWTSTGGPVASIAPFVTVGRTDRGELAPPIDPVRQPVVARSVDSAEPRSDRDEVAWIKEHSGLTWDQLGKVFGVSRRAVHMWANGGRLNESNARRLREFSAIIRDAELEIGQRTPEGVRARLLQVESDGLSIVDRLRRERSAGPTWGAPFGPERMVDSIRGPLRTPTGEVGL